MCTESERLSNIHLHHKMRKIPSVVLIKLIAGVLAVHMSLNKFRI